MTRYPAQPWWLVGHLHASVFAVPRADLPAPLPPGAHLFTLGGRAVVVAAWVSYEPGGVLEYRELMSTVVVRHAGRLLPTITHIWVNSEASRDGGRELWGIPKQLAEFDGTGTRLAARVPGGPVASATVRRLLRLPVRVPFRFSVVQERSGAALSTPVRGSAAFQLSRVAWRVARQGPLGFLWRRRPLLSLSATDFRMSFGRVSSA